MENDLKLETMNIKHREMIVTRAEAWLKLLVHAIEAGGKFDTYYLNLTSTHECGRISRKPITYCLVRWSTEL